MKVAFLHRDLPPLSRTGVATQVHRLACALVEKGIQVDVFTAETEGNTIQETGVTSTFLSDTSNSQSMQSAKQERPYAIRPILPANRELSPWFQGPSKRLAYPWAFRQAAFEGYDLVHIHGDGTFLPYQPHWLRTFYGTAYHERLAARTPKAWLAQAISWWGEKRESRHCLHMSAIATHVQKALPQVEHIIPCMLAKAPDLNHPESLIKAKAAQPTLIHVGSLYGRKQGKRALDIWHSLRKRGRAWRLHLVCPAHEAHALSTTGLHKDIHLHAGISEQALESLYAESWVALSLSRYEGFGLPIIEAFAHACHVLARPHAGAKDILTEPWPESLVEIGSMTDSLLALESQLTQGEWNAAKCLSLASKYAPTRIAEQYLAWYDEVWTATQSGNRV